MTEPAFVYLAIGLIVARIELDGTRTRGFTWLQWLQFLVDAARISLLWPLVLLVEKMETWLKSDSQPVTGESMINPETISAEVVQAAGSEPTMFGEKLSYSETIMEAGNDIPAR